MSTIGRLLSAGPPTAMLWAGAVAILAMMLHVAADVILKVALNAPIMGTLEIVSFIYMVACTFLPLPHVLASRGLIVVELFTQNMAPRNVLRLDAIVGVGNRDLSRACWASWAPARARQDGASARPRTPPISSCRSGRCAGSWRPPAAWPPIVALYNIFDDLHLRRTGRRYDGTTRGRSRRSHALGAGMDSITLAFVCLVGMVVLMAIRVPIAIALGLTSFAGIWALKGLDTSLRVVGSTPFEFSASWNLSAIPMFLLMGGIAFRCGLTSSLFDAARLWLARLPGGLAVAANFASAMFAAASGSSVATAAAMGRLAIPEMLRYRYDPALATATVAAAGTLGSMIPPSIAFVIFGWYTETPIGKLLIAGIFPGLLNAALFAAFIITYCIVKPDAAPPPPERPTCARNSPSSLKVWPIPALILCVIGGIYSGLTTATEAAAFGAFCALVIAWLRGGLPVRTSARASSTRCIPAPRSS